MTPIRITCPTCMWALMIVEGEGEPLLRIALEGEIVIRCPKCMEWKNVLEQFRPYALDPPMEADHA